ncbi:hypothetical protein [Chryseobacterium indoltheticum]|uniref:Uncharacterized protein n=1 Tax=Chryseobacterium indoltheticum TaxID=254 RepID=A0A381F476_9FLAO|nr:hypothetical protein [Chryseobacterium indoltheticum]AZA74955.1 hypothetical protein EG358_14805 [Chryseobacterium indoltheticum]SIQ61019.1 hypothetical protein SAMN05421682_106234 [Chryseobacterium indoltheticum]SUX41409.1 Uncharacterised protein [Chryseobacterium indoltheticum]
MEIEELTTRDQLKTYFETGKYPTQSQFSDLIDSFTLKEDVMTNREAIILANRLASIDNAFIYYFTNNIENLKFPIVISSQDEEDQVITLEETNSLRVKQFLLGSAPYTFKTKKISEGNLKETEYYGLEYQLNQNYFIYRLFGNNLNTIPEGFEFGKLDNIGLPIQISKGDYGRRINVVNTSVKFVNKTEVSIQYRIEAAGWSDRYRDEDTVTDHYDIGDYLVFYYNADLRKTDQSIQCDIYDEDNGKLLTTGYLHAGQNQTSWNGGQIVEVRNARIECYYSAGEK